MPGDEQVRYNHVEALTAGCERATTVIKHEVNLRSREQPCVPGGEVCPCCRRHLGHEFKNGRLFHAESGSRARTDTGREADKGDTARIGVE